MESKACSLSVGPRHEVRGRDKRILQAALVSTGPTGLCNSSSHPLSGVEPMIHVPIPKVRAAKCVWGGVLFLGLWIRFSLSWVTDVGSVEILRKGSRKLTRT